jgi:WD40 repeat protein
VTVQFSPDDRRILTASWDGTAKIWDAQTAREMLTFSGHAPGMSGASFSPDGRRVASASSVDAARVWDAETGREYLTLKGTECSWGAVFSRDGLRLATSSANGQYQTSATVSIWQAAPWRDEDLPGNASMSYDDRLQLWKVHRWKERQKERPAGLLPTPAWETPVTTITWVSDEEGKAREMDSCAANLRKIHAALVRYRNDHGGEMPYWLSDLVPNYITSDTLLCPSDPEGVAFYSPDPRLPCSYGYQFTDYYDESHKMPHREWKLVEMREWGDIGPTARCYSHAKILNLSYGGKLFLTPQGVTWQTGPREDYVSDKTAITSGSLTSSPKKSDTAITGTAPPKP